MESSTLLIFFLLTYITMIKVLLLFYIIYIYHFNIYCSVQFICFIINNLRSFLKRPTALFPFISSSLFSSLCFLFFLPYVVGQPNSTPSPPRLAQGGEACCHLVYLF